MKIRNLVSLLVASMLISSTSFATPEASLEALNLKTNDEVLKIIKPLMDKYCKDSCQVLSAKPEIKLQDTEETAPGFDEIAPQEALNYKPALVTVDVLVDEIVGQVTLSHLFGIIQEHLSILPYPVILNERRKKFPQPLTSVQKMAELRNKVATDFRQKIEELFREFCPKQCILADLDVSLQQRNLEEAQYNASGEYITDGDTSAKINKISGQILFDTTLTPDEQTAIFEMAQLKTNSYKSVNLQAKSRSFPHPEPYSEDGSNLAYGRMGGKYRGLSSQESKTQKSDSKNSQQTDRRLSSSSNNSQTNQSNSKTSQESQFNKTQNESAEKSESYQRTERIERVESGDAVQAELKRLSVWGVIFACSVLSLLIFIALATYAPRSKKSSENSLLQWIQKSPKGSKEQLPAKTGPKSSNDSIARRYEIDNLIDELTRIFAEHPKVAKHAFTRVLTEEGVEITAAYISILGESIVLDLLKDPSLQNDVNELTEYYAKNTLELKDEDKLELLKKLHNRAIASKLQVIGNRSSNAFDFLVEMDGLQILEMIQNESLTVKAIVLTQCDTQKRAIIYSHWDDDARAKILKELSRIDHLPRNYIYNVSNALRRKRQDNPRLNTEALPGSEVLVGLLEKSSFGQQQQVVMDLEQNNPESARVLKSKLVSIDTLRYLRDSQLLEVVLSLKHEELLAFLKGAPDHIRKTIFDKSPKDLAEEIQDELTMVSPLNRDTYQVVERKILNRVRLMANDGLINLIETNERMFAESPANHAGARRAAGW